MSVQTIIHNSRENLKEKALKGTIDNANKFLLKKRFKLGKGYCEKDQFHNSIINDIMQITVCDLVDHVNDIIENGPKDCSEEDSTEVCVSQSPINCSNSNVTNDCAVPIASAGSNFTHQMNPVSAGTTNTAQINGSESQHNAISFQTILWEVIETPNNIDNGSGSYIFIQTPDQLTSTIGVTNNPIAVGLWKLQISVTNDCGNTATEIVEIILEQNNPQ